MKYQIKSSLGDPKSDILSITTNKSMSSPSGTFSITFVPKLDTNSRTWFNKLDAFDYVEIGFQGIDDSESRIVMRGIIDSVNKTEYWEGGTPKRAIVVNGRDLGSLLENHNIYYIPEIGKKESMESYLKVLAWKKFFPVSVNALEAFEFIMDRFEESVNVSYNDISITEKLGFTAASTFDQDRSNLFHLMGYEGPYWNALQQYQDKPFHEIFIYDAPDKAWLVMRPSRLKDALGDFHNSVNAVKSHILVNRILKKTLYGDELAAVLDQANQKNMYYSLTPEIMYPDGIKVSSIDKIEVSTSKMHNEVFNYYLTIPALMLLSKQEFRSICLKPNQGSPEKSENPFFQIDPSYPAYIGKYGFRKYEATTYFINLKVGQLGIDDNGNPTRGKDYEKESSTDFLQKGIQRNRMMVAWFLHNEHLLSGSMDIRGTNQALIGTYVEDTDENMEYYIENVNHSFVVYDSFRTTLGLTRGQPPVENGGLVGLGEAGDARYKYETLNPYYFSGSGTRNVYREIDINLITGKTKTTPNQPTAKPKFISKTDEASLKQATTNKQKKCERRFYGSTRNF